jgi:hypothetical protein
MPAKVVRIVWIDTARNLLQSCEFRAGYFAKMQLILGRAE